MFIKLLLNTCVLCKSCPAMFWFALCLFCWKPMVGKKSIWTRSGYRSFFEAIFFPIYVTFGLKILHGSSPWRKPKRRTVTSSLNKNKVVEAWGGVTPTGCWHPLPTPPQGEAKAVEIIWTSKICPSPTAVVIGEQYSQTIPIKCLAY